MIHLDDIVLDRITNTRAVIVAVDVQFYEDWQTFCTYYELSANVPTSPNYPTRWRHISEIIPEAQSC